MTLHIGIVQQFPGQKSCAICLSLALHENAVLLVIRLLTTNTIIPMIALVVNNLISSTDIHCSKTTSDLIIQSNYSRQNYIISR